MKKRGKEKARNKTNNFKIVLLSSALSFAIAVITFSALFYFAVFFDDAIEILFKIIVIAMAILFYYILVTEFAKHEYNKDIEE